MASRNLDLPTDYTMRYSYEWGQGWDTTTLVRQVSEQGKGFLYAWNYGYDSRGNLVSVKLGTEEKLHYAYDSLSQLTRVDDAFEGRTHTYTYDAGGNLTSHQVYAYTRGEPSGAAQKTVSYGYGDSSWKDKLTSYNGQSFTYDAIGNPLTWRDGMALTWKHGRELDSLTKAGTTYNYSYDEDGYRVKKQSGTSETLYYRNGGTLLTQKTGNDRMDFLYDENEQLLGFRDNGTSYYYRRNIQGDITGILDGDGTPVVAYTYDAWGRPMSCTGSKAGSIGQKNPFRYRGYYYDAESGLYYLNSRYYDPEVGRFMNADIIVNMKSILGFNRFCYCDNNPIMFVDFCGYGKVYVIYYNNPGSGFEEQAMNSPYYDTSDEDVYMMGVTSSKDFIDAWNDMNGEIDSVYLYLHGGTGELYFKGESMGFLGDPSFENLEVKKVKQEVYLFSCHGGSGKTGNNVARMFVEKTETKVYACTGSVSYSKVYGKYFPRKALDLGRWKTFRYNKRRALIKKLCKKIFSRK